MGNENFEHWFDIYNEGTTQDIMKNNTSCSLNYFFIDFIFKRREESMIGFREIFKETNSVKSMNLTNLGDQILSEFGAFIDDIRFLGSKISVQVGHVPREGNKLAHEFANVALSFIQRSQCGLAIVYCMYVNLFLVSKNNRNCRWKNSS